MPRDLKRFVRDQRGASMPEYALLLFAVLISAAAAVKRVGPRVYIAGDVTRRLLAGEDVEVQGSTGNAFGGLTPPSPGSSPGGESSGSSGAASGGGGGLASGASGSGSSGGLSGSSTGGGAGSGGALGSSGSDFGSASNGGGGGGGGLGSGLGPQSTDGLGAGSSNAASETANNFFGSSAPANNAAASNEMPQGFLGGTGAPNSNRASGASGSSGSSGSSASAQNSVNPPPPSSSTEPGASGDGYAISAAGEKEMQALLAQAKKNADGKRPLGYCYRQVKEDIAEVGYGDIAKQGNTSQLKPLPGSDQEYAHDFADYMNATAANGHTNADNLGLQKLPITNPYDAPPGSIVVVRAGTPGTRNPVAGDIVVAGGGGKFFNDGNMGYGGSKNFPKGNTYVLGIYAPK